MLSSVPPSKLSNRPPHRRFNNRHLRYRFSNQNLRRQCMTVGAEVSAWASRTAHSRSVASVAAPALRDGIIYGALVGLGFNWFEAALYVTQGYAENGVAPYGAQLGGRYALFGLGGHAMFTGIFGASLGLAIQTRRRWVRILVVGLVFAIAAHMLNNALPDVDLLRVQAELGCEQGPHRRPRPLAHDQQISPIGAIAPPVVAAFGVDQPRHPR